MNPFRAKKRAGSVELDTLFSGKSDNKFVNFVNFAATKLELDPNIFLCKDLTNYLNEKHIEASGPANLNSSNRRLHT